MSHDYEVSWNDSFTLCNLSAPKALSKAQRGYFEYNSAKTSTEISEYILFFPIDFNNSLTQISIIHYSIHKMLNISFIFTAVPLKGSLPKGCRL